MEDFTNEDLEYLEEMRDIYEDQNQGREELVWSDYFDNDRECGA